MSSSLTTWISEVGSTNIQRKFTFYNRGRQPVVCLACQAISVGTQKLQVLRVNFVMIHKKYYWPWLVQNGCIWHTEWFRTLNWHTFTKTLPALVLRWSLSCHWHTLCTAPHSVGCGYGTPNSHCRTMRWLCYSCNKFSIKAAGLGDGTEKFIVMWKE